MKRLFLTLIIFELSFALQAQNWTSVGSGTNWSVSAIYNDTTSDLLYVGGYFTTAGGISANRIAAWDGAIWNNLGTGVNHYPVWCITKYNGEIYAGGVFDSAGNVKAKNIARWNGASWDKLLNGTNDWVKTMAVYNNELYVGGNFTTAGGTTVNHIAKWDGSNWSAVNSGVNGSVSALQVYNGKLYVGGGFNSAGTLPAYYIAAWDGTNWSVVGNGLSGGVYSMTIFNGNLYINYGLNTAIWDGIYLSAWSGASKDNNALCMISENNNLLIGGHFTSIGGNSINRIAKWNQSTWSSLGSGVSSGGVFAMAIYHNDLYAGGWFDSAGTNPIPYLAKWSLTSPVEENSVNEDNYITVSPNPFSESTSISFHNDNAEATELIIYNSLGLPVKNFGFQNAHTGEEIKIQFLSNELQSGIYYAVIHNHETRRFKKIIILK